MVRKSLVAAGLFAASVTTASAAPYGFFDARSLAMGNVSVATGNLSTAAFANPAMLAIDETDDDFSLLLPAVGAQVIDNSDLVDKLDEFQNLYDQFQQNPTDPALWTQLDQLAQDLENDTLLANGNAGTALAFNTNGFAMAASYRAYAQASAAVTQYNPGTPPPGFSPSTANLTVLGFAAQEMAVSLASDFKILGIKVAWGVTPKTVSVEAVFSDEPINLADTSNIIDSTTDDLGSFTTADAGVVFQIFDSLSAGLVAKNLIEESLVTSGGAEINFNTMLRAGVSYHNDWMTIAADLDLQENDPLSPVSFEDPSRMLAVGAEFDVMDILQLRAGYQTNLASDTDDPDLISAGVGLWLGFNLDIAVVAAENSSFGAFIQTGFHF